MSVTGESKLYQSPGNPGVEPIEAKQTQIANSIVSIEAGAQPEKHSDATRSQNPADRIFHLEQALDQALASLNELRLQVRDQHVLETQLVATEEFSHVQQQAIGRLKQQLTQQQRSLEIQIAETQAQEQALQDLRGTVEQMTQTQQTELEHLRLQISRDRTDMQTQQKCLEEQLTASQADLNLHQQRVLALEAQSLADRTLAMNLEAELQAARQQAHSLSETLSERQTALTEAEGQRAKIQRTLQEQQALMASLSQTQASATDRDAIIFSLQHELSTAQLKIEDSDAQLAKQVMTQARLQQSCQELEGELHQDQTRVGELERQVAEMQEQILKQARQASEYETAVQHWKDRFTVSQQLVSKLRELLEQVQPERLHEAMLSPGSEPIPSIADLLSNLPSTVTTLPEPLVLEIPSEPPAALPHPSKIKVDLPAFLSKRRPNSK